MNDDIFANPHVILALLCFLFVLFLCIGIAVGRLLQKIADLGRMQEARDDAVRRSRAVLGGLFGEQIAPLLPDFPCNPGDVRFVGKPVDYIAFPGSAEGRQIKEILFIEVKSGDSQLSPRERDIKAAVTAGRVRYVEYRLP